MRPDDPMADGNPSSITTHPSPNGTSPTSPGPPPELPEIHGFEIRSVISSGERCVIYRAIHRKLGYDVAICVAKAPQATNDLLAGFLGRIRQVAALQGPQCPMGIPHLCEVSTLPDGRHYAVMKPIEGDALAEVLATRPTPFSDRMRFLRVFEEICCLMAYAHRQRIVHCRLSSQNVLIDVGGRGHIVGWGGAIEIGGEPGVLNQLLEGASPGEPQYMPPEQARGEWSQVDARTDVFALGALLTEILTGCPPYDGKTTDEIILKAKSGDLAEALARLEAGGTDSSLLVLVRRCLGINPTERPADAGELARLVSAYRGVHEEREQKAEAEGFAAVAVQAEREKRKQWQLGLVLVSGFFLIWVGVFIWWQERQNAIREAMAIKKEPRPQPIDPNFRVAQQKAREVQEQRFQQRRALQKEIAARLRQPPPPPSSLERALPVAPLPRVATPKAP